MSYGGERRRGNYDRRDNQRDTPEQRIRSAIVKLGEDREFHPAVDLKNIARTLRKALPESAPAVSEGFRIGITEQPYKIPYLATLLSLLVEEAAEDDDIPENHIKIVLDELCKGFQAVLDTLAWREIRSYIQLFSHLALSKTVSAPSLLALLQTFTVVLEEPGVSYPRAQRAILCAGEGLIRAGSVLYESDPTAVKDIVASIKTFSDASLPKKSLVRPLAVLHSNDAEGSNELIESLLATLGTLQESNFSTPVSCLPQPHTLSPESDALFDIPMFLVPPEDVEIDRTADEADKRKEGMPSYSLRLYDSDISPDPRLPSGYVIRSIFTDTINIFEVNRKECARILLEMPRWFEWRTFRGKNGAGEEPTDETPNGMNWLLENTVLESILSSLFALPASEHKLVYYFVLITDLCKASPATVGPAVGKSFRKLYTLEGQGLDVEIGRRFAEWFASHMSNFGFNWVWKEWIPDLELPVYHPKRSFIRRAIELETRLSYHDRVIKTLPEELLAPKAKCIPEVAPGFDFEYDDAQHAYYEPAQSLLGLVRGKSKIEEVIQLADTLRQNLSETITLPPDVTPDSVVRAIVTQILLHVGARSFSHFLNAIERYLPLLRSLGSAPEDKVDFLTAAGKFWARNGQMVGIVFDKLMQYQIVDPSDVIGWCFKNSAERREDGLPGMIGIQEWDNIRAALDKAIGRVSIAHSKVQRLQKEEEDVAAKVKAVAGAGASTDMDVDVPEAEKDLTAPPEASEQLLTARKAYTTLTREQKNVLARTLEGFVSSLVVSANPTVLNVVTDESWATRDAWSHEQWAAWETWGWYRQFCRAYAAQLKMYVVSLESGPFATLPTAGSHAAASTLMMEVWKTVVGRDDA